MLLSMLETVSNPLNGAIDPERLAETLHVSVTRMGEFANLHRNTLQRNPGSPLVQERLGEIARILADAAELMGGSTGKAVLWFLHQPLSGFDGKTAAELVRDGQKDAVRVHLQMLRDGVYA
jgi:uncharacterized protein (DUF2384 family)